MFEFWPDTITMNDHVSLIKPTRQQCLDFGETPARSRRPVGWNTALSYTKLVPFWNGSQFGNIPPGYLELQPGGYDELPDLTGASGSWCGTTAGFARILQMMHPNEAGPLPSGPRFSLEGVLRMGMRQLEPLADGTKGDYGLGCKYTVSKMPLATGGAVTVHDFMKGGTMSSARAQVFHMVIQKSGSGSLHSISIVSACTGGRELTATASTCQGTALRIALGTAKRIRDRGRPRWARSARTASRVGDAQTDRCGAD